jgi:hypothetical protein
MWPFHKERKHPKEDDTIKQLKLDVSRERTKLFSTLTTLDTIAKSSDFEDMVHRSLQLMGPKK